MGHVAGINLQSKGFGEGVAPPTTGDGAAPGNPGAEQSFPRTWGTNANANVGGPAPGPSGGPWENQAGPGNFDGFSQPHAQGMPAPLQRGAAMPPFAPPPEVLQSRPWNPSELPGMSQYAERMAAFKPYMVPAAVVAGVSVVGMGGLLVWKKMSGGF